MAAFANDAVTAVTGNSDTAAHRKPLHEGYIGFGIGGDHCVQAIFIGPKFLTIGIIAPQAAVVKIGDIAACTKGTIPFGIDDNQVHFGIVPPCDQSILDLDAHVIAQRIQRLWPCQRDASGAARNADVDIAHLSANI